MKYPLRKFNHIKKGVYFDFSENKKVQLPNLDNIYRESDLKCLKGVFHPYSLVKDHRTQVEVGNTQAVVDGNLDRRTRVNENHFRLISGSGYLCGSFLTSDSRGPAAIPAR
jgi:hypothetical protein